MPKPNNQPQASQKAGIVHQIDLVNREMTALVEGLRVNFYVPTDCDVVLRGERVKLRMIRSRDRVRVSYSARGNGLVANSIEVQ